jgi:2-C-methyl-D-erythritol 4-phosphate cytidylyltransferase
MTTLGVLPVGDDDPDAPRGCAALRLLRRAPVLRWSVAALAAADLDRVLVLAPPALAPPVARAVADLDRVEVVPVPGLGAGHRLRTALRLTAAAQRAFETGADGGVVLLHDPLYPLATAAVAGRLLDALLADPGAVAALPVHPLTETVKRLGPDGLVHETVDRAGFVVTATPQAYRHGDLLVALERAADADLPLADPAALPDLLLRSGHRLLPVRVDDLGPRADSADALARTAAALP